MHALWGRLRSGQGLAEHYISFRCKVELEGGSNIENSNLASASGPDIKIMTIRGVRYRL